MRPGSITWFNDMVAATGRWRVRRALSGRWVVWTPDGHIDNAYESHAAAVHHADRRARA